MLAHRGRAIAIIFPKIVPNNFRVMDVSLYDPETAW